MTNQRVSEKQESRWRLQRRVKGVRMRRKVEVLSDDSDSSSESIEETEFSDEEMQEGTSGPNEVSTSLMKRGHNVFGNIKHPSTTVTWI